jgi:hypothetical protein
LVQVRMFLVGWGGGRLLVGGGDRLPGRVRLGMV